MEMITRVEVLLRGFPLAVCLGKRCIVFGELQQSLFAQSLEIRSGNTARFKVGREISLRHPVERAENRLSRFYCLCGLGCIREHDPAIRKQNLRSLLVLGGIPQNLCHTSIFALQSHG